METTPRPVSYAARTPALPWMNAPVGKSGPGTYSMSSTVPSASFSIRASSADTTSPRLWGGMFVDMPTAMPDEPLTSRFGNLLGRTAGSWLVSS